MSKIALKPNASGTGVFSLEAPNSNTDRALNLPDEAGTVLTNVSDIESQVKTATNATGSAPVYACRAWVNFDGTGTVSIRDSGNVSSITDNGTGDYTVNFATNMPDNNYSAICATGNQSTGFSGLRSANVLAIDTPPSASSVRVGNGFSTDVEFNAYTDSAFMFVSIFR